MIVALATLGGMAAVFGLGTLVERVTVCRARTTLDRAEAMTRHPAGSRR